MVKRTRFGGKEKVLQLVAVLFVVGCSLTLCSANDALSKEPAGSPAAVPAASPLPAVPCAAQGDAVIANTGRVFSQKHSLIDSYVSLLGAYGGINVGNNGTVQAAKTIDRDGGIIHGPIIQNTPAGLTAIPVPADATPLPLGSQAPGRLEIHHKQQSVTLKPGNYVATDIDLDFPGQINVFPPGLVTIFVMGRLELSGEENVHGRPSNLQFIVTSSREIHLGHHGTLVGLLYAPSSKVELHSKVFGSVIGRSVKLHSESAVHFDQSLACPIVPLSSHAVPPAPLPSPPPAPGCYVYTRNGWQSDACATAAFIKAHFPHPDAQLTVAVPTTQPLVYGQVAVTIPQVASENNAWVPNAFSGCPQSGSTVANQWSVQNNTNPWTVASGPSQGHQGWTQFVAQQADGNPMNICIWNIDLTTQDYTHTECYVPKPGLRPGGLQPGDIGNIAGFVNSDGTLSMVAQLSWVPNNEPNTFAVTGVQDTYGLAGNWSQVGGGLLGEGGCSQAQLTNAEVVTQIAASTCQGDTDAGSPVCPPPVLQPSASVNVGPFITLETNNLVPTVNTSLSYPNKDLVVTNITATTSGSCLGPDHAYIKDSPEDFGATPSTLGNQVFWESPDIFLVPHGDPVDLTSVSTETTITPGGMFDIWVRVHNDLGCSDVTNAKTLVYLADPSALSVQWTPITNMQYVGNNMSSTGVTVPAGGQALIGPIPFTAPTAGIGNGHKCILAAIEADGEAPPANNSDAPDSNQVAQRNIQFGGSCEYPLTNGTSSDGSAQISLTVTPNTGTTPSLTVAPDVEVTFDDADSSWFNVWNSQTGNGTTFAVTHNPATNSTTVRLGAFSVALNAVPLAASQTRNATASVNPDSGTITLQIAATLTGPGGNVVNGGSCTVSAPVGK